RPGPACANRRTASGPRRSSPCWPATNRILSGAASSPANRTGIGRPSSECPISSGLMSVRTSPYRAPTRSASPFCLVEQLADLVRLFPRRRSRAEGLERESQRSRSRPTRSPIAHGCQPVQDALYVEERSVHDPGEVVAKRDVHDEQDAPVHQKRSDGPQAPQPLAQQR